MTNEDRFRRIEQLFHEAVALPIEERSAFVIEACGSDTDLRWQVERLLEHDKGSTQPRIGSILRMPVETPGDRIGPYRLVEQIGEGGMGVVFRAQQEDGVKREVALKLIKWGMDTRQVVARFEAERQAMAMMEHPDIARVFDAGATENGRPFFVMEYVPGIPINRYCDERRLKTAERLRLLARVCDAVHHAHQKGIIHRDLKPSNILVSGRDGQHAPKIIDFGIAKATSQRLTERTVFTELGQLIGTPEYMSPEQAASEGQDVDTRSDIYSLGVVLYELLAGILPFDPRELRQAGFAEIQRRIAETDPPRPSTRISSLGADSGEVARIRGLDPRSLVRRLRGDLDWIVMRAMEKDPARRYRSASELSADIARHLKDEPVLAGPPAARYRIRKFARRHRVAVAAALVVALALAVGTAGASLGMIRAIRAEKSARTAHADALNEAERANKISDFLVDMFRSAEPERAKGEIVTARELLDNGAAKLRQELADQPIVRARLLGTMGIAYHRLGAYDESRTAFEDAIQEHEQQGLEDDLVMARLLSDYATLLSDLGEYKKAVPVLERALEITEQTIGAETEEAARILNRLSITQQRAGDTEAGLATLERALAIVIAVNGPDASQVASLRFNLGVNLVRRGRHGEALPLLEDALVTMERDLGPDHPTIAIALGAIAGTRRRVGDPLGALPLYERALAIQEHTKGSDHFDVGLTLNNRGWLLIDLGRLLEAEADLRRAVEVLEGALGPEHRHTATAKAVLATAENALGRVGAARAGYEGALDTLRRNFADSPHFISAHTWPLARLERRVGKHERAGRLLLDALRLIEGRPDAWHDRRADVLIELAMLRTAQGRADEATAAYDRAVAEFDAQPNGGGAGGLFIRAEALALAGDTVQALTLLERAVNAGYATARLELDPEWDALRGDPEFERLTAIVAERIDYDTKNVERQIQRDGSF